MALCFVCCPRWVVVGIIEIEVLNSKARVLGFGFGFGFGFRGLGLVFGLCLCLLLWFDKDKDSIYKHVQNYNNNST